LPISTAQSRVQNRKSRIFFSDYRDIKIKHSTTSIEFALNGDVTLGRHGPEGAINQH